MLADLAFHQMIQSLSRKHREVVVLYYWEEMTTKEIARALGLMEGTVKSRLHMARKQMQRELHQQEKYPGGGQR